MKILSLLHETCRDLAVCGVKDYLYYNFIAKNCTFASRYSRIKNEFSPSVWVSKKAHIHVNGVLTLNEAYPKKSQKKAVLRVEEDGCLEINGRFNAYYDTELWVYPRATLSLFSGYINAGSQIRCMERIVIGKGCAIGRNVLIMDFDAHEITYKDGRQNRITAPITIGDHVWIGAGATILKGVTVGEGAVIGAGSVVTKDVAPHTIVAGNPAKTIKEDIQWR